jgi:hypothetical protein
MIVRREDGRKRLVLQTDHAQLAGEFAAAWGNGRFRPTEPLDMLKLTTEIHDDGWAEWERAPRINPTTGSVYDFLTLPPDQHVAIYERGIRNAILCHPYAGLLVSLHGTGLHRRRHGHMPHLKYKETDPVYAAVVERYVCGQVRLQSQLMQELRPDGTALWTHYRLLQAWDLLSVILALFAPTDRRERLLGVLPHYPGGPAEELRLQGESEGHFTIDPWPFGPPSLALHLPVRYLPDCRYDSDEAFGTAFAAAPTEVLPILLTARGA